MNYCTNLRLRTKKGIKYFFCVRRKAQIERKECYECNCKEIKKTPKMMVKTRIKPISKKRKCVSEKTYNIVLEKSKDNYGVPRCGLCGAADNLQYHHVLYRSERKDLIDDPSNGIMLCHKEFSKNKCHAVAHSNKKKYQSILLDILDKKKTG